MITLQPKTLPWQEIPGWLTPAEGETLQNLARGKAVLELGSYKGRATICMSQTARQITTVDWHDGDEDIWRNYPRHNSRDDLETNILNHNGCPISITTSRFEDLSDDWLRGHEFEMVFIDGQHDADSVERDTKIALKTGAPLIVFHDANYPTVNEGARRAGLMIRRMGDPQYNSVGVGEPLTGHETNGAGHVKVPQAVAERPKVALCMPRYGPDIKGHALPSFAHHATRGGVEIYDFLYAQQSIAYSFNALLAQALDWRDAGLVTHFAMQHADIAAVEHGWLDLLWAEMQEHGADVMSVVSPIKDDVQNPKTSTAIGDKWNDWFPKRFIHVGDRGKMPETFGAEHVCQPGSDEVLLINTSLWLADLRKPWWDYFNFSLDSRIVWHEGKRVVQMRSEDWQMSRFLQMHNARIMATWKVTVAHVGEKVWLNRA